MKKLNLRLEDLHIDSFAVTDPASEKGTVFGEQCTCHTACTCPGCPTCYASCGCPATGTGTGTESVGCPGPSDGCTWEASCGGMSCVYTCGGWMTEAPDMMCVECLSGVTPP